MNTVEDYETEKDPDRDAFRLEPYKLIPAAAMVGLAIISGAVMLGVRSCLREPGLESRAAKAVSPLKDIRETKTEYSSLSFTNIVAKEDDRISMDLITRYASTWNYSLDAMQFEFRLNNNLSDDVITPGKSYKVRVDTNYTPVGLQLRKRNAD